MNDLSTEHELTQSLTAALEHKAVVAIPADFAARVARQAAALPVLPARPAISYGRLAAIVCAVVLLLAMFVLAAQAKAAFTSVAFDVELLLLAQLLLIGWWLITKPAPTT